MMGSLFAFGTPTTIRGYSELKHEPQKQRNLLRLHRIGGVFLFVLGQLILLFAVLELLTDLSDVIGLGILLLLLLAYVSEIVLLIGCKVLKKWQISFKLFKKWFTVLFLIWFFLDYNILIFLSSPILSENYIIDIVIFGSAELTAIILMIKFKSSLKIF